MANDIKMTADEWLKTPEFAGITVLDPDGWDRCNFVSSWNEAITHDEFDRRLSFSTCSYPASYFQRYNG